MASSSSNEETPLSEPRKKKGVLKHRVPLPLEASQVFIGHLVQDGVRILEDPNHCLYHSGAFGTHRVHAKRVTAKSAVNYLYVQNETPDISSRMDKAHHESSQEKEYPAGDTVFLQSTEAFFLCYAIGCLHVKDAKGDWMNIEDLWLHFKEQSSDFSFKYCVYHHFRAKGWVVKCGLKYGGDFLLYKWGPEFYHASYSVLVVKEEDTYSWRELSKLNRVCESVAKELMLAVVSGKLAETLDLSKALESISIQEVLVKRWIPSQERENT